MLSPRRCVWSEKNKPTLSVSEKDAYGRHRHTLPCRRVAVICACAAPVLWDWRPPEGGRNTEELDPWAGHSISLGLSCLVPQMGEITGPLRRQGWGQV